ncbi:MAG TPA: cell envelope integrity protein TolA [Saprospiraceae bacterium]|nr:cell envelope integrity protein TolA [Saprospiraceae bacterium]
MMSSTAAISHGEQVTQGKGWIVSLVLHIILCALLFLPMIAFHIPPPVEEGLIVSLGLPDEGQGEEAPSINSDQPKPENQKQPEEEVQEITARKPEKQVASKIITSNEQDAVRVREAEAKKQAQEEAHRKAAEEAKKQEEYNKTKKSYGDLLGGNGKGNTGKPGSQGDPNGDPNASALEGISKGSGRVGGGLDKRGVLYEPKINDRSQKTGRVVINVCVDKTGKVIKAEPTQKGTTTPDSELKDIARKAALQFKFTASEIVEQCGTITVDFKVRG